MLLSQSKYKTNPVKLTDFYIASYNNLWFARMGVAAVWDVIKPGYDTRCPFPVLASKFYEDHGRPMKIAIDAYQWIFECRGSIQQPYLQSKADIGKFIQNFFAKIRYMLCYNISFVLVFDGRLKPSYKRDRAKQDSSNVQLENADFDIDHELSQKRIETGDFKEYDAPDVVFLKELLKIWKISYIEAPAEGEAEAARLQSLGKVDYVLSNDSDVLIFGAVNVLKNFSKYADDKPASSKDQPKGNELWCTPVNMVKVESSIGFNRERLMLFSILCGADYNKGVESLGPTKSAQLALSGSSYITTHIPTYDYDDLEDFSQILTDIYKRDYHTRIRKSKLEDFKSNMLKVLEKFSVVYFRRKYKFTLDGFPPDYIICQYHKPLVLNKDFKFETHYTNSAKFYDGQHYLKDVDLDRLYDKIKKVPLPSIKNVGSWFSEKIAEAYVLKGIVTDSNEFGAVLERIQEKSSNIDESDDEVHISYDFFSTRYRIPYDFHAPIDPLTGQEPDGSPRKKKGELLWIPIGLVPPNCKAYTEYLMRIEEEKKTIKVSPSKKSLQRNTLSTYLNSLSPPKTTFPSLIMKQNNTSPTKRRKSKTLQTSDISLSEGKRRDILTDLKNSPRKKIPPLLNYGTEGEETEKESIPSSSPSRLRKPELVDANASSPILIDTTASTIIDQSMITIDDSDEDIMDVDTSKRKLNFSSLLDDDDDDDDYDDGEEDDDDVKDVLKGINFSDDPFSSSALPADSQSNNIFPNSNSSKTHFEVNESRTKSDFWDLESDKITSKHGNDEDLNSLSRPKMTERYSNILNRKPTLFKSPFQSYDSNNTLNSINSTPKKTSSPESQPIIQSSPTLHTRNVGILAGIEWSDDDDDDSYKKTQQSKDLTQSQKLLPLLKFDPTGKPHLSDSTTSRPGTTGDRAQQTSPQSRLEGIITSSPNKKFYKPWNPPPLEPQDSTVGDEVIEISDDSLDEIFKSQKYS